MRELPDEIIRAEGVVLRPPRLSDADDIAAACTDPAIQRYVPAVPSPYTRADAVHYITEGRAAMRNAGGLALVVADPATDRVIGSVGLHHVWAGDGLAEIGYWVAPWARGRGVATAATAALAGWGHQHGLYRVELLAEAENWPSQRVAIAAGFRREGVRRAGGRNRDGSRVDLVVWAHLAADPPGPSPRSLPDLPGGVLTDGVVQLRPLWSGDVDDMFALRSLPESIESSVPPVAPDPVRLARRCAESPSHWLAGERAELTVRDAASGAFAGDIGLFYQDQLSSEAMIGYGLMPAFRGRGFATRTVRLIAAWAFAQVGVARLIAGTAPENVGSQRVLERAGFTREGYLRSRLPGVGGTRIDDILWALLPGELVED
ncbi:MAG TPA: GNAT family N-acetyltransferase [Rugosimonospora sp.]|nr:GNAT family N-acetyltransferase [Rugosimonospora sp.]